MARRYELRERAARMEQTRRRIVDATVALHEEVGPARTTVAAVADRAGVSRPTVYAQFPDDLSLLAACSARFRELHPYPHIDDLALEPGLALLYRHFAENRKMLAHVQRDARALPALAEVLRPIDEYLDAVATGHGAALGGDSRPVVRLALDFSTWARLDNEGLSADDGAALMARVVACTARAD
jgi:AcrR family transcriptional regulator